MNVTGLGSTKFDAMENKEDSPSKLEFKFQFKSEYAEVYTSEEHNAIICILTIDYVPIQAFRQLFGEISTVVSAGSFFKFIFDKRSLRTFHQPSMEWYFIEWKLKMLEQGLTQHRKILPNLDWFKKAVEIARKPLLDRFPAEAFAKIDIQYCENLEEALLK